MSTHIPTRVQGGAPEGGQFATSARPEPDVSLTTEQYSARAAQASTRSTKVWEVRHDARVQESAHAAAGLAALIRSVYPSAATIQTEECDQAGCDYQHVAKVLNADGTELSDTHDEGYEDIADDAFDLQVSLDPHSEWSHGYMETSGSERQGYTSVIRIDDALAAPGKLTKGPADRGAQTIASYRALHDDLDLDDATAARDMLTDLHRWARTNDVDLNALFTAASQVADEEETEGL